MMITKMALPRRTFLKGLGASVALPLLDSMVPAFTAQAATAANVPRRLGFVFIPMGMNPEPWTPKEVGRLTQLSPSLASLSASFGKYRHRTNHGLEEQKKYRLNLPWKHCHFSRSFPHEFFLQGGAL